MFSCNFSSQNNHSSYDPYDKVTIESQVYVGFINDEQIIVTVSMGGDDSRKRNIQKEYTITIKGK